MLSHFQTADDAWWAIDTKSMTYGHWTPVPEGVAPTLSEMGKLVAIGGGVFALEGRDPKTPAPGAGLCAVGIEMYIEESELKIRVYCNVPIKNYYMPKPVNRVKYIIVGPEPAALPKGDSDGSSLNSEQKEPPRPQEPEVGGGVSADPPNAERGETQADMESDETGVAG